jgi:hypothetical protein
MQQHFQREAKECKLKTDLTHRIWHIWITFATTWFIFTKQILFLYLYKKHLFWQIKRSFKSKFDQMPQTPPFSHNKSSPP